MGSMEIFIHLYRELGMPFNLWNMFKYKIVMINFTSLKLLSAQQQVSLFVYDWLFYVVKLTFV